MLWSFEFLFVSLFVLHFFYFRDSQFTFANWTEPGIKFARTYLCLFVICLAWVGGISWFAHAWQSINGTTFSFSTSSQGKELTRGSFTSVYFRWYHPKHPRDWFYSSLWCGSKVWKVLTLYTSMNFWLVVFVCFFNFFFSMFSSQLVHVCNLLLLFLNGTSQLP